MNLASGLPRRGLLNFALLAVAGIASAQAPTSIWAGYGGNSMHTAQSAYGAGQLNVIKWQTPVDTNPTYSGNDLLIHYGEPGITCHSNVVIPVRHGQNNPFTVECHNGATGNTIWSVTSSYILPSADWTPSMGPVCYLGPIAPTSHPVPYRNTTTNVAWPESGGRVGFRTLADSAIGGVVSIHAFYGDANYASNSAAMDANVQICTPLTAGPDGSIYFGYYVSGSNPILAKSGVAVMHPNGTSQSVDVSTMSGGDGGIDRVAFNCAPALSRDGSTVYIGIAAGSWGRGYLVSLSSSNLNPISRVQLIDPLNGQPASVVSDGTSSPMVAPDGSVFYGVLENSFASNNDRGWMEHYSGDLTQTFTPGEFGWDITPSVVPSSWKPDGGTSNYYIACKYNNYVGLGSGDGMNKVGILDPSMTQQDNANSATVMYEVETLLGQTPNSAGGFYEWCINSIAIDMVNKTAIVNSEDGTCYAWNLVTDQITSKIKLTAGIGEAYTSTVIAPNGNVYAISNGILFAITTQ